MESDNRSLPPVQFSSSLGPQLSVPQVVRAILDFMRADTHRKYKIIIGTDSERQSDNTADFVTAIVIHRVGNGGRYFWRRIDETRKFHTLRDRIVQEVLFSLEAARMLLIATQTASLPEFDFEIHADVGENGATKATIQEVVGMIRANNFEARTKPDSYAASKVADRHV